MAKSEQPWTLTARWVVPVDGPPLEHGTVTIQGERFVAVQPRGVRKADIDLGNAAILPGLVNAHTHLDLSGMRGKCPPTPDFTQWLRGVIAHRRTQTPEKIDADIQAGIKECLESGTTLLGDIAAEGRSWNQLKGATSRAVVFRELIGLPHSRQMPVWREVLEWHNAIQPSATCRPGLSPHAPYSVNGALIRTAAWNGWQMTIHLAETAGEMELLAQKTGPFVEFLTELGVWEPEALVPSIQWLLQRIRRASWFILAHCNYLPVDVPIPNHGTIVYCPRTHAAFGHTPHPFREFLARGVRVALGTDSLASNPDLDVLAEARFVRRRYPEVSPATVLHMATLAGAEALGWADETGSITPGKSADLVVLPLPDVDAAEPYSLILESDTRVKAVLFRGRWTVGHP